MEVGNDKSASKVVSLSFSILADFRAGARP